MGDRVALLYSPEYLKYNFGPEHPFMPRRMGMALDLMRDFGLLDGPVRVVEPPQATEEELCLFHHCAYVQRVKELDRSGESGRPDLDYGLGTEDTPMYPGIFDGASRIVGGTLLACRSVMEGNLDHAFNIGGGLHHAREAFASGFCVFNDAAIGIAWLRHAHDARVLYIDIDAHHGDGVQFGFYQERDVLTISFHETGRYLYPGTGHYHERGSGEGYGYSVNVALDAFTDDESWLEAFDAVVPRFAKAFCPDLIMLQAGCDAHYWDPLTHLNLTTRSYEHAVRRVHEIAHELCGGRLVALGGGGYDIWRVVPRAWTLLMGVLAGVELANDIPASWMEKWQAEAEVQLPTRLRDDPSDFPVVPRKPYIDEANRIALQHALEGANLVTCY
jgi:acetoin utilization protein AcuC